MQSQTNAPARDNNAARQAADAACAALMADRPAMNKATAWLLLANAVAIRMSAIAQKSASDFLRATGDAFAPLNQGKELADARRLRAAQDFIKAAA